MAWVEPVTLELGRSPTVTVGAGVVRLVPLQPRHAEALWDALGGTAESSREVLKYHPGKPPADIDEMRELLALRLTTQAKGEILCFTIVHVGEAAWSSLADPQITSGRPIGMTSYLEIQPANRSLEIGSTWIGPRWQRTRVNTECKYLLFRHAFESLGFGGEGPGHEEPGAVRVFLRGDDRNRKSFNAVMRLGAKHEGTLRKSRIVWDGVCRDTWFASVLREEWFANSGIKSRLETMLRDGGKK